MHSTAKTAESETTQPPLAAATATKKIAESASDAKDIEEKRDRLAKLLRKRKEEGNGDDDMSQSIEEKINQLDKSYVEIIMNEN